MKNYTIDQMEDCIYANRERKENFMSRKKKVTVKNFTQIDDRYIVVETDNDVFKNGSVYKTCDMERMETISMVSGNRDLQILITLGLKYDGLNSQFSGYADRMLGITVDVTDKI